MLIATLRGSNIHSIQRMAWSLDTPGWREYHAKNIATPNATAAYATPYSIRLKRSRMVMRGEYSSVTVTGE